MSARSPKLPELPARPSRSAEEARRLEVERVLALTPLERVRLALGLGRRMRRHAELGARSP